MNKGELDNRLINLTTTIEIQQKMIRSHHRMLTLMTEKVRDLEDIIYEQRRV